MLEGLDPVGGVGSLEGLESLGVVGVGLLKWLGSLRVSGGAVIWLDSLEGLGSIDGIESLEGLVVPSASSSICRIGDTGREIWNVDGMTLRRFFGPGLRRSGISSLVFAILSHPSQMGLFRSRKLQPLEDFAHEFIKLLNRPGYAGSYRGHLVDRQMIGGRFRELGVDRNDRGK